MGGLTSRNKGKRGEREVVKLLQSACDEVYEYYAHPAPVFERNQMQSNLGGYDNVGLEWLAVEVKFQEQLQPDAWWKQTTEQAGDEQIPVLFYRKSRMKWRVRMFACLLVGDNDFNEYCCDIHLQDFVNWFQCKLSNQLK